MKILAKEWRSAVNTVGFIAYDTGFNGEWNSVVGYKPKLRAFDRETGEILGEITPTEDEEAQYIADHGAKIEWQVAHVLFPHLDITKHKYYFAAKKCWKCKTTKDTKEFYKNKSRYDGLSDVCKICDGKRVRKRDLEK